MPQHAANTYALTYAYIANADRVSSITTTAAGATVATQTYTYNARNQITKEKVQDGVPATTWERDYTYTAAGLRTKIDDLQEQWDSTFQHDPAGRLVLVQTTDYSSGAKSNPFPWWEGDTKVSTSPNGDVVSMVSGANRITYRYDEEHRLVEAQMASGDPVQVTYDGMGNLVSIVQGATTQKTLTYQGRLLQTRNSSDVLQDRLFWMGNRFMRLNIDSSARNQAWDARGSNDLSYQTDGTMDKTRMWDNWGLEVFAAGAGSAPDVGFLSNFDLAASGLSITPRNNAWWAELGRSVEGGWHPKFELSPFIPTGESASSPVCQPGIDQGCFGPIQLPPKKKCPGPDDKCGASCCVAGYGDMVTEVCKLECIPSKGGVFLRCPEGDMTPADKECTECMTEKGISIINGTRCKEGDPFFDPTKPEDCAPHQIPCKTVEREGPGYSECIEKYRKDRKTAQKRFHDCLLENWGMVLFEGIADFILGFGICYAACRWASPLNPYCATICGWLPGMGITTVTIDKCHLKARFPPSNPCGKPEVVRGFPPTQVYWPKNPERNELMKGCCSLQEGGRWLPSPPGEPAPPKPECSWGIACPLA